MTPALAPSPLSLGPLRLASNLELAPIAGYCDLAFRTIVREWSAAPHSLPGSGVGVGLACTDLLSPQGLLRGTATSLDLAATNAFDKPIGMQLYGSDPALMAEGARWAVAHGATVIDINMGCPVDKVTKKDGGSKLLTDLPRALSIVHAVTRALEACPLSPGEWSQRLGNATLFVHGRHHAAAELAALPDSLRIPVPLTCKMRLCWSTADYQAGQACSPHLARALADAGVVAVTVHGRTTEMKFSGSVIKPGIARVVDAVNGRIPVLGNGDVRTPHDALAMLRETGCAGVMIGRGALSTPWLFRDAWALQSSLAAGRNLNTGDPAITPQHAADRAGIASITSSDLFPPEPSLPEKIATIRRYLDLMIETRGTHYAMVQIRRRITWFAKRLMEQDEHGKWIGVRPLKDAVRTAADPTQVHAHLDHFLAGGLRGGDFASPHPSDESSVFAD